MKVEQISFRDNKTGMDFVFQINEVFEHIPRTGEGICLLAEDGETEELNGVVEQVSWMCCGNACSITIHVNPKK